MMLIEIQQIIPTASFHCLLPLDLSSFLIDSLQKHYNIDLRLPLCSYTGLQANPLNSFPCFALTFVCRIFSQLCPVPPSPSSLIQLGPWLAF